MRFTIVGRVIGEVERNDYIIIETETECTTRSPNKQAGGGNEQLTYRAGF